MVTSNASKFFGAETHLILYNIEDSGIDRKRNRMAARKCYVRGKQIFLGLLTVVVSSQVAGAAAARTKATVDFNRQIRPIFSENCYTCHGPDAGKRKAGLRLDRQDDAMGELKSGNHAIV